jgi:probable phosphoglycerate mutase
MIPRSFYFLRHGQTDWNVEERLQGHTDTLLNENGRAQARAAAAILEKYKIDRIVSSPLVRAFETAEILNAVLQKPLEKHDGLKERHFGLFEGKTRREIDAFSAANPHLVKPRKTPSSFLDAPESEPYEDFSRRITETIGDVLQQHEGHNILFVGHGGVYRSLCRHFFGETEQAKNSWPYHFVLENGVWTLKELS